MGRAELARKIKSKNSSLSQNATLDLRYAASPTIDRESYEGICFSLTSLTNRYNVPSLPYKSHRPPLLTLFAWRCVLTPLRDQRRERRQFVVGAGRGDSKLGRGGIHGNSNISNATIAMPFLYPSPSALVARVFFFNGLSSAAAFRSVASSSAVLLSSLESLPLGFLFNQRCIPPRAFSSSGPPLSRDPLLLGLSAAILSCSAFSTFSSVAFVSAGKMASANRTLGAWRGRWDGGAC